MLTLKTTRELERLSGWCSGSGSVRRTYR